MNIILFGPPGVGKGTQGDNLVNDLKLFKISAGDILREEINKESLLGKKIKLKVDQGLLVPNEIIDNLIENILSSNIYSNRLIFDGYPRNLDQAKNLDVLLRKYNQKISCVLSLNVQKNTIIKRIMGRQVCSKCGLTFNKFFKPANKKNHNCDPENLRIRSDDNEPTIMNRFNTYIKETFPIIKYYQKQNLVMEVDGMNEIDQIYKEIRGIIDSLDT